MKKVYLFLLLVLGFQAVDAQVVRRVKPSGGTGPGIDGSDWASNAYKNIQDAINASSSGDEVWVAAGVYLPTEKLQTVTYTSPQQNIPTTDRDQAFILKGGVKVYGGFNGTETLLSQRDVITNLTVLSGDLNGDDVPVNDPDYETKKSDNVYHVVSARNNSDGAILDGFTISGGYANGTAVVSGSGNDGSSSLTIAQNCGGAIALRGSNNSHTYVNLIIKDNYAADYAGAAALYASGGLTSSFDHVIFSGNSSANEAGAMRVFVSSGSATINIKSSRFISNSSGSRGGAIYAYGNNASSNPTINVINSLFYGNISASSTLGGGAIALGTGTTGNLINSTFYSNSTSNASGQGGAVHISSSASCQLNAFNSIFNQNVSGTGTSNDIYKGGNAPAPAVKNNLTQSFGVNGVDGNIVNDNPSILFASTDPSSPTFLTLATASVVINMGDKTLLPGGNDFDLAGNPRVFNSVEVDMGAFEYQGTLPVALVYFKAEKRLGTNVLNWATKSEEHNHHFIIERGATLDKMKELKTVAAKGPGTYTVVDESPLQGKNYYRLTQYDQDGKATVLGLTTISFDMFVDFAVYPNPAKDVLRVETTSSSNAISSVELVSITGAVLQTKHLPISVFSNSITLDVGNVPNGIYILKVINSKGEQKQQRVVIAH